MAYVFRKKKQRSTFIITLRVQKSTKIFRPVTKYINFIIVIKKTNLEIITQLFLREKDILLKVNKNEERII